jgi:hypothetical protein
MEKLHVECGRKRRRDDDNDPHFEPDTYVAKATTKTCFSAPLQLRVGSGRGRAEEWRGGEWWLAYLLEREGFDKDLNDETIDGYLIMFVR